VRGRAKHEVELKVLKRVALTWEEVKGEGLKRFKELKGEKLCSFFSRFEEISIVRES
jgi:hypothetical protein